MRLALSGRPIGLKIDKDGKEFVTLEPSKDAVDLQEVVAFVNRECSIKMLSSKRDLNMQGYIEELSLKNKLKLRVRTTEDVDLNILNQLIDDPETTSIIFNDGQAVLTDFEKEKTVTA